MRFILKLIEIIFKLLDKYKKNMMEITWLLTWLNTAAYMAQHERSNIKCYVSAFSII